MIAQWMLYSLATSAALFAGACAADYVGRGFNRSTRMLWLAAMVGSIVLAARAAPGSPLGSCYEVAGKRIEFPG